MPYIPPVRRRDPLDAAAAKKQAPPSTPSSPGTAAGTVDETFVGPQATD
jgi:hypothetical protein